MEISETGGTQTLERKVKVPMADGRMVDGFDVPVLESTERWTEARLEDGTIFRVKPSIISAIRIEGQYDADGNPMYALKSNITMVVAEVSEHHKRPAQGGPGARRTQ